jgi:DMSO/TMAO reductase YedYZ molybdopterin-dependent catalytic subunit
MLFRPGKPVLAERSTERLPPGQRWVKGWPVLHEGEIPAFDPANWRLRVWGEVEREVSLDWATFTAMPQVGVTRDWHCVTTWSRMDVPWAGVPVGAIMDLAGVKPGATHVLLHAFDEVGYTTDVPIEDFLRPENLFATHHGGAPITPEHGGPIRAVVHHLYAWKSAKWLSGVEVLPRHKRGYWEVRGYHKRADPWLEERYSSQE